MQYLKDTCFLMQTLLIMVQHRQYCNFLKKGLKVHFGFGLLDEPSILRTKILKNQIAHFNCIPLKTIKTSV